MPCMVCECVSGKARRKVNTRRYNGHTLAEHGAHVDADDTGRVCVAVGGGGCAVHALFATGCGGCVKR